MPYRIKELHYIIHIENIGSVVEFGILSHEEIKFRNIKRRDLSNSEVQLRRYNKYVPNGLNLHHYANCYFDARNPMMYKLISEGNLKEICVLKIDKNVILDQNVIITDRNAAIDYARFLPSNKIDNLDFDSIFAKYWIDSEGNPNEDIKGKKCAEALVPDKISYENVFGAYVVDNSVKKRLSELGFEREITINPDIFFR